MTTTNGHFPTTDLTLAVYLMGEEHKLVTILYEGRNATFLFQKTPELQRSLDVFMAGNAIINLSKYEFIRGSLLDRIKRGA